MGKVRWRPKARADLRDYRRWLDREAGTEFAHSRVDALLDWLDELRDFPRRGIPRDDLGRSVRTRVFRGSVTIAYGADGDDLTILRLFARGRDGSDDFPPPE